MSKTKLKKSLSLPILVLYGLGNILGAGIYVLVGKVAGESGPNTLLAFLIAMGIASLTAFSYMELSGRFPVSASSSIYTYKAFNKKSLSIILGIGMVLSGITSAAALAKGFAGYVSEFIALPSTVTASLLLIIIGIIAIRGIGASAIAAAIFTIIEVIGLLIIIYIGKDAIVGYQFGDVFKIDPAIGMAGIMSGAFLAFYAFIGFEDMVNVAEEAKNPRKSMPIAVLLSLSIATVLYSLVVIVATTLVTEDQLAASDAPLSLVFEAGGYRSSEIISLIGIAATLNGVVVQVIMGSRMLYGMAKHGWLNKRLATVHPIYKTPVFATVLVVVLMIIGVVTLPLVKLASLTSLLVLTIFGFVNASLLVIKKRYPHNPGYITVPYILPLLGLISCIAVIAYQILSMVE